MNEKIAQVSTNLGPRLEGLGPFGLQGRAAGQAPSLFNQILTMAIGIITIVAGIWFLFLLITGAIQWMGAGGDKGAIEDARKRILNGVIGLAIVVAAIFLVDIVGGLLGIADILDPASYIPILGP